MIFQQRKSAPASKLLWKNKGTSSRPKNPIDFGDLGNFDWELGKDYKIEARYREYSSDGKLTKVELKLYENNEVANVEPVQKLLYKYNDNTVVSDFFENNRRYFSVTFCYNAQNLLSEVSTDQIKTVNKIRFFKK